MSFEVTATRKRPQKFDQIAGQEFVVSTLKNSVEQDRIAHAYIFSGPRGVGKTSAARILAKSLNCENGPSAEPCGVCNNCKEITSGNSLDVIEIDGASNTSVNDIREIKDEVLFSPNNSRYKIFIIDEVHMLSNSAFNALLKTIEEPPPYIVFIFATTEIHKVPATIRSRCQQFNFRLIPLDDIKEHLEVVCQELNIGAEKDALYWIAKEATGSLRDAYTLFDQVVSFSDKEITMEKIREKLGVVGVDRINQLMEFLAENDSENAIEFANSILQQGISVEQFVIDLAEYFRNILFIKHKVKKESILGVSVEQISKKVINAYTVKQVERALAGILQLYKDLRFSLNQRFELELLLSRFASLALYIEPSELIEKLESLRDEVKRGEVITQKTVEPVQEVEEDETELEDVIPTDFISTLRKAIKSEKVTLASSLDQLISWEIKGDTLFLVFEKSLYLNLVRDEMNFLSDKAAEIIGHSVKIDLSIIDRVIENKEETVDESLEMVQKVFKGQIVEEE